jgi:hypothetical protein
VASGRDLQCGVGPRDPKRKYPVLASFLKTSSRCLRLLLAQAPAGGALRSIQPSRGGPLLRFSYRCSPQARLGVERSYRVPPTARIVASGTSHEVRRDCRPSSVEQLEGSQGGSGRHDGEIAPTMEQPGSDKLPDGPLDGVTGGEVVRRVGHLTDELVALSWTGCRSRTWPKTAALHLVWIEPPRVDGRRGKSSPIAGSSVANDNDGPGRYGCVAE